MSTPSAAARADTASALTRDLVRYCVMALLVASILRFVSGRPDWGRAWFYVAFLLAAQTGAGLWLRRRHPDLMAERSRMRQGAKRWDKILAPLVAIAGPIAFWATAAGDIRTHWPPPVPMPWSVAAFVVCALGFALTL